MKVMMEEVPGGRDVVGWATQGGSLAEGPWGGRAGLGWDGMIRRERLGDCRGRRLGSNWEPLLVWGSAEVSCSWIRRRWLSEGTTGLSG